MNRFKEWVASKLSRSSLGRTVLKGIGPTWDDLRMWRTLREMLATSSSVVIRPYSQSVWVFAAINAISQNIARVPFNLKREAGPLEPAIVEEGELYDLFQNPNPFMTKEQLIEHTFGYYELYGEAFWILEGRDDISQIPKEIWIFPPGRFEPEIDTKTNWLLGWRYRSGTNDIVFPLRDVIQFKKFNPYHFFRGLSPLEAGKLSVETDYYASTYNKVFFENGAVTSLNITFPEELGEEAYQRLIKQFEDRHTGARKAHRIVLAEGGAKITEGRMGQKDIEFVEGKKLSRTEIFGIYNVNEIILGIFDSVKSEAGVKSAHKSFWEECLMPRITYFEGVLWSKFFSKIGQRRGKGKIWGEFDLAMVGPLQENFADKVETGHKMWTMGWPINHINKRLNLGMQDVPWGNEWWVPGGYASVNFLLRNGGAQNQAPGADKPQPPKEEEPKKEPPKMIAFGQPIVKEYKSKVKTLLFSQRKNALMFVFNNSPIVHSGKGYEKLKKELQEVYLAAIYKGRFLVWQESGKPLDCPDPSKEDIQKIKHYAEEQALFVVDGFKSIIDDLTSAFEQFRGGNGHNNEDLAEKIREIYNYLSQKSGVLSETEVHSAISFGRQLEIGNIKQLVTEGLLFPAK